MRVSSRDRRQITRAPSATLSAPATTAAATSPMECPITAAGRTPCARHSAASPSCMANSTGWMRSQPTSSSPARSAARTENPVSARISGSTSAIVAANAGSTTSRSRPIPGHCDPCPENTQTVSRGALAMAVPVTTFGAGRPATNARRPATSSSREDATTPSRPRPVERRRASV